MTPAPVYTIGHSNHPLERFQELLQRHGIQSLVDIRRFPVSRRMPHFNGPQLAESLVQQSIEYHWLEPLGGHRTTGLPDSPNDAIRNDPFRFYADHMLSDEFRDGVEQLLQIAQLRTTAIMCAEGSFRDCHRNLVSDYLVGQGIPVRHILPNGELADHMLSEKARIRDGRVTYPKSVLW